MNDRLARKHAFKLASVVIVTTNRLLLDGLPDEHLHWPFARWCRQVRRQAGRLMVADDPGNALQRYERDISAWLDRLDTIAAA